MSVAFDMDKPFLLIAGYNYHPSSGTDDWQVRFSTREEVENQIIKVPHHYFYSKGKNKGEIKRTWFSYKWNEREYDWYEIVDLRCY